MKIFPPLQGYVYFSLGTKKRMIVTILVIVAMVYSLLPAETSRQEVFFLNENNASRFQILELLVLPCLFTFAIARREYGVALLFATVYVEHIRQMSDCYRTKAKSIGNIVTLCMWMAVFVAMYLRKIYWALPFVTIGICTHTVELLTGIGLLRPVCLV